MKTYIPRDPQTVDPQKSRGADPHINALADKILAQASEPRALHRLGIQ